MTDLIKVLEELEADAKDALSKLRFGESVTGNSALARIKNKAGDAARHAREEQQS